MIDVLYCPEEDQIYEFDGRYLEVRHYCEVGGCVDETGATYYSGTIAVYNGIKDYGLIKLGTLEGPR